MADLRPRSGNRAGERGQLLLIAAFLVGVSFVVLALVVNSAIFTENLATRDDVPGSDDALDYRHEVSQNLGDVITAINQNNSVLDDYSSSNLDTPVENNVETLQRQSGVQQSSQGRVVDLQLVNVMEGIKIAQDRPREFTNDTDDSTKWKEDWIVVKSVTDTRNMVLNITEDPTTSLNSGPDPFQIDVIGSDETWSIRVADASSDDVVVEVDPPNGNAQTCTSSFKDYLVIDITAGTIGDEPCHALTRLTDGTEMWFATGVSPPYNIEYINGDKIVGTYYFIIESGTPNDDLTDDPDNWPYSKDPAVYQAFVYYQFYTADVGYETVVNIKPGDLPP